MINFSSLDPALVVGRVFTGIGVISLVLVVVLLWQDKKEVRRSTKVTGTVSSLDYNPSGTAAPVIGYRINGKKHYYHGKIWSSPPGFEVGEEVELLVREGKPDQVIINSFFERYFFITLLSFFAMVFGGIGTALLTFMKK